MKSKILTLIIGILIGAIIATTGWFIYTKVNTDSSSENQMEQMQKPDGNGGENMQNGNMTEPPSKPDGDTNSTEPPAKPDDNSSSSQNN